MKYEVVRWEEEGREGGVGEWLGGPDVSGVEWGGEWWRRREWEGERMVK